MFQNAKRADCITRAHARNPMRAPQRIDQKHGLPMPVVCRFDSDRVGLRRRAFDPGETKGLS